MRRQDIFTRFKQRSHSRRPEYISLKQHASDNKLVEGDSQDEKHLPQESFPLSQGTRLTRTYADVQIHYI